MPACNLCGSHFPNWILIDGVKRNLGGRKYCLTCSPRGVHNTRKLTIAWTETESEVYHCNKCQRDLARESFYLRKNGTIQTPCKDCRNHPSLNRGPELKRQAVEYKGGCCIVCGYNRYFGALVFHHLDPETKDFTICQRRFRSILKIKNELDKCALLCINCHRRLHAGVITLPDIF